MAALMPRTGPMTTIELRTEDRDRVKAVAAQLSDERDARVSLAAAVRWLLDFYDQAVAVIIEDTRKDRP
jgi:hypothetical protein